MERIIKNKRLRQFVIYFPEIIAAVALVITLVSTGINVFTRYIFKYTFFWYTDVTVLAFGWLVFMGTAAAYRRHMHFGIDMLVNTFPKKFRAVFDVLLTAVIAAIILTVFCSSVVLTVKLTGKQFPTILLSYKWYDASMVVGFGLMTIYSFIDVVRVIKSSVAILRNREAKDNE